MTPEHVVIVGSSVAGIRTGQALRTGGFDGKITVLGAENEQPYDKPPLSKQFLSGDKREIDIGLLGAPGWEGNNLEPRLGVAAKSLDAAAKTVFLENGESISYDHLVLATGAKARKLLGPDGTPAAYSIRDLGDARELRDRIRSGGPVVVVGGGFVGAEAAATASALGAPTTLVEAAEVPFARVLGPAVGQMLTELHELNGVTILAGVGVESVNPQSDGSSLVTLADGRTLEAWTVIAGIGVIPNTEWLQDSGLPLKDGVVCDEYCRVEGFQDIYAIGDVARWKHAGTGEYRRVEHWTNAVDQANLVAANILNPLAHKAYVPAPYFWSDQYDAKIQMIGEVSLEADVTIREFKVMANHKKVALYSSEGALTAAVSLGWPRAMVTLRRLWAHGATLQETIAALDELARSAVRVRSTVPSAQLQSS